MVLDAEQPCFSRAQGVTDTQSAAWQPAGTSLIKKIAQNRKNGNKSFLWLGLWVNLLIRVQISTGF